MRTIKPAPTAVTTKASSTTTPHRDPRTPGFKSRQRTVTSSAEVEKGDVGPPDLRVMRALLCQYTCAVVFLDADLRIVWVSSAVRRLTGYKPDELVHRQAIDLLHPDDLSTITQVLQEELRYPLRGHDQRFGERPLSNVVRVKSASGDWQPLEVTGSNLFDEPGVAGLVLVLHDFTQRQALDDAVASIAGRQPLEGSLSQVARFAATALRRPRPVLILWRGSGDPRWQAVTSRGASTALGPTAAALAARQLASIVDHGQRGLALPPPLLPLGQPGWAFPIQHRGAAPPAAWLVIASDTRTLNAYERHAVQQATRLAQLAIDQDVRAPELDQLTNRDSTTR